MSQIEADSYEVVLVPDESQESQNLLQRYVSEFGIPGFVSAIAHPAPI